MGYGRIYIFINILIYLKYIYSFIFNYRWCTFNFELFKFYLVLLLSLLSLCVFCAKRTPPLYWMVSLSFICYCIGCCTCKLGVLYTLLLQLASNVADIYNLTNSISIYLPRRSYGWHVALLLVFHLAAHAQ